MISVPSHVKNSKIGQDIRRTPGNPVIILRDERFPHFSKALRMATSKTAVACMLVTSVVLYTSRTPFLRAEATSFYPKACLGGFEGVGNAEGKPETKVTARSDAFDRDISAFLSGEQSAEMYCGNFDGKIVEKTLPKSVTLTLFLATKTKEESQVIKSDTPETTNADFLEVLDATKVPILESGTTTPSASETATAASSEVVPEPKEDETSPSQANENTEPALDMAPVKTENQESVSESVPPPQEVAPVKNETQEVVSEAPSPVEAPAGGEQALRERVLPILTFFVEKVSAQESPAVESAPADPVPSPEPAPAPSPEPVPLPEPAPESVPSSEIAPTEAPKEVAEQEVVQAGSEGEKKEETPVSEESVPADITTSPLTSLPSEDAPIKSTEEKEMVSTPVDIVSSPLDDVPAKVETVSVAQSIKDALESFQMSDNTATTTEHPFFEIAYNLGGEEWTPLAYLGKENSRTISLTLPLQDGATWADIGKLQVRIKNTDSLDKRDDLYVDGMALSIGYEKDREVVQEYRVKDIENTSEGFEVTEGGEDGLRTIQISAREKSGIAIYDLDSKRLVLTTETSEDNLSEIDPKAAFYEYGVYGLFFTTDTSWCSDKELEACLTSEDLKGISFISLVGSPDDKESKSAKVLKKDIREKLFARGIMKELPQVVQVGTLATSTEIISGIAMEQIQKEEIEKKSEISVSSTAQEKKESDGSPEKVEQISVEDGVPAPSKKVEQPSAEGNASAPSETKAQEPTPAEASIVQENKDTGAPLPVTEVVAE